MPTTIVMPRLGAALKEGRIVKWSYQEGQHVDEGDTIVEIETEKINYQIEAPASGILRKILTPAGSIASVGQTIGVIIAEGESTDESEIAALASVLPATASTDAARKQQLERGAQLPDRQRIKITPIARRIAGDRDVDIAKVKGSGPDGVIIKEDILAFADAATDKETGLASSIRLGAKIPLTRARELIGERLTASSRDVPHVYFACEVDGTGMIQFREAFLGIIESKSGVRLSFNDIILKAAGATIEKYPLFNATLEGKTIHIHEEINMGLAVALDQGLIVPVIRRVNEMSLDQIARARRGIIDKANQKKLTLDDLAGGTFTISNLGQFNIDFFTSIINPPETAILSVAKMKERPVVIKGEITTRPTVMLGLSADHRIVDGAMAATFLQELQNVLENPYVMCRI